MDLLTQRFTRKCQTVLCFLHAESGTSMEKSDILSLVKLTRSGLVLLKFPFDKSPAVVDIVSQIFQSLESGILKSPL